MKQYESEFTDCGVLDSLCSAYLNSQNYAEPTRKEFFHLRDFVYFLRFLGLKATRGNKLELTPSVLLEGLQRNFNGIPHTYFEKLVHSFFEKMHASSWGSPEAVPGYNDTFVELMKSRYCTLSSLLSSLIPVSQSSRVSHSRAQLLPYALHNGN